MLGVVKWFNKEKGFGFIKANGQDVFCHFKEIKMDGFKNLIDGESVEFELVNTPRGPSAKNIRPTQFTHDESVGNC